MEITFEVIKWDDFNPRRDLKTMPWFRLASDIGYSETLYGLTPDAKWLWVFLLSTCARKISGRITTTLDYISDYSKIEIGDVEKYLNEFAKKKLILLNPDDRHPDESVREPNESDRVQNGVTVLPNGSVPKKREEERREEEKREEAAVGSPLTAFFNHEIFRDTDSKVLDAWIQKYEEHYVLQEFQNAMDWKNKTELRKPFQKFFDAWLARGWKIYLERKSKSKKIAPEVEANAKRHALNFYENIMKGTEQNPWSGDTDFDFELMSKLGDLSRIRQSKPSDKQQIILEIKTAVLETMDTG